MRICYYSYNSLRLKGKENLLFGMSALLKDNKYDIHQALVTNPYFTASTKSSITEYNGFPIKRYAKQNTEADSETIISLIRGNVDVFHDRKPIFFFFFFYIFLVVPLKTHL